MTLFTIVPGNHPSRSWWCLTILCWSKLKTPICMTPSCVSLIIPELLIAARLHSNKSIVHGLNMNQLSGFVYINAVISELSFYLRWTVPELIRQIINRTILNLLRYWCQDNYLLWRTRENAWIRCGMDRYKPWPQSPPGKIPESGSEGGCYTVYAPGSWYK
jgi:hypothetical protein